MKLLRLMAFTIIAVVSLGAQVEARSPCEQYVRLRNAATKAWKRAMRVPQSERCAALHHASLAAEATLDYANSHRESCDITDRLLDQVDGDRREAKQARDNVCAGRPIRPYPLDIIQH